MKTLFIFFLAFSAAFGQIVIDRTIPPPSPAPPRETVPVPVPVPEPQPTIEETFVETIPAPQPVPVPRPVPVPVPEPTLVETVIETETETIVSPLPTEQPLPVPLPPVLPPTDPAPGPPTFLCDSEECCLQNAVEGIYSLRFTERCLDGGLHCVEASGCEVCRRVQFTDEEEEEHLRQNELAIVRPPCDGPPTCESQECCDLFQAETGQSLRFHERCLSGGAFCYELTGCQFCAHGIQEPTAEALPSCDPAEDEPCLTQECCNELAQPNPQLGTGYLELNPLCADEDTLTEHCVALSGCQLCYDPQGVGENVGDRPLCSFTA